MYSSSIRFVKNSLTVAISAALLTACGGGGGGGSSDTAGTSRISMSGSVSGTVADGYIMGATAFLDIDGDKQLDTWEPSSKTDIHTDPTNAAAGTFTVDLGQWVSGLTNAQYSQMLTALKDAGLDPSGGLTAADLLAAFSIVVEIPEDAIDTDRPTEKVGSRIKLSSPPKPKGDSASESVETFVSPITTVLDQKVTAKKKELKEKEKLGLAVSEQEKDVSTLVAAAKKEVKQNLGLEDSDSDDVITGDYIKAKSGADANLAHKLHTVAKITTTLLAKGVQDTAGDSQAAAQIDDQTKQAIIDAVTEKVLSQINIIAAVSDKIVIESTSGGTVNVDIAAIDTQKISEQAQVVASEDSSLNADSLTEVSVDQDEIEAAKAAVTSSQEATVANTEIIAFLQSNPAQILSLASDTELGFRLFDGSRKAATWGSDSAFSDDPAAIKLWTGTAWVDVTVAQAFSGESETLTFTPSDTSVEPVELVRSFSGNITDLSGEPIRAVITDSFWKAKITAGTVFSGTTSPERAKVVVQLASEEPVTLQLSSDSTYQNLTFSIDAVTGLVTFKNATNSAEVTSYITPSVYADGRAFSVPSDIAARFNIPEDKRDWYKVPDGSLGYQLGKNPVIYDWFNSAAFDQISSEVINTDGLVSSKNLVASLESGTVTVSAAPMLVPDGWVLSSVVAEETAVYGGGASITVSNTNTFGLGQDSTAKVTLTYSKSGAEDIVHSGYVHRGKASAGDPIAGRDYRITSQLQWNGSAYEHGLEIWLREGLFSLLKDSTLDGTSITSAASYEVKGDYRVYQRVVAADAGPVFDLDGTGAAASVNVTGLPSAPAENPTDLSSVTVSGVAFDGYAIRFSSLSSSDVSGSPSVCFELTLTKGEDSTTRMSCPAELSGTGEYDIPVNSLDIVPGYFDSVSVSGISLNETISTVEIAQTKTLSGAASFGLPQKGSLTDKALAGEMLYLAHYDAESDALVYFQVSYTIESGWQVMQLGSEGSVVATDIAVDGNTLHFKLNGTDSSLALVQTDGIFETSADLSVGGEATQLTLFDTFAFNNYLKDLGLVKSLAVSWDGTVLSFAGIPSDSRTIVINLTREHDNILLGSVPNSNLYAIDAGTTAIDLAALVEAGGIATEQNLDADLLTALSDGSYTLFAFSTPVFRPQVESYIAGYGPINDNFLQYFGDVAIADYAFNVNYTPSQLAEWIMSEELYADFSYNLDNKHYQLGFGDDSGQGLDTLLAGSALEIRYWNQTTEEVLKLCSDASGCEIALDHTSYAAGDELRVYLDDVLQESVVLKSMAGMTEADVIGVESAVYEWFPENSTVKVIPKLYGLASEYRTSAGYNIEYQDGSSSTAFHNHYDDGFAWNGSELSLHISEGYITSPITEVVVTDFAVRSSYQGIPLVSSVVPLPDLEWPGSGDGYEPSLLDVTFSEPVTNTPKAVVQGIPESAKTIAIYIGQKAGGILVDRDDIASSIVLISVSEIGETGTLDLNSLLSTHRLSSTKSLPDVSEMADAAYDVYVFASDYTPEQTGSVLTNLEGNDFDSIQGLPISARLDESVYLPVGSYTPTLLEQWDTDGKIWAAVKFNLDKDAYEFSTSWNDPNPESPAFEGKELRLAMFDGSMEQTILTLPDGVGSKFGNVSLNLNMGSTLRVYLGDVLQESLELDSGMSTGSLPTVIDVTASWDGSSISVSPSFSGALPTNYELDMELELTDAAGNVRHLYLGDHYPGVSWDGSVLSYTPSHDDFVISDAKLSFFELRITENEVPAVSGVYSYDDGKIPPDGSNYGLKAVFTDLTTTAPKITVSDIPAGTQSILIGIDEKEPNFLSDYDDFQFIEMWAVPTDGATTITVNLADVVNNGVPMKELSTLATPVDLVSIADSTFFVAGVAFTHSASDVMAAINSWGDRIDTDYFDEENGTVTGFINQSYIETGITTGTVSESANAFADEDNSGTSFDFSYSVRDNLFRFSASSPWFFTESSLTLKVDGVPLGLAASYIEYMSSYEFGLPYTVTNADLLGKTLTLEFNNGTSVENLGSLTIPAALPVFGVESITLSTDGADVVLTPTFAAGTDLTQFVSMEIDGSVDVVALDGTPVGSFSFSTWDETTWDGTAWRLTKAQLLESDSGVYVDPNQVDWAQSTVPTYFVGVVSSSGLKMRYSAYPSM